MTPKQIAIQNGDNIYEGKPCKKGHTTRYTSAQDRCARCKREEFNNLTEDQLEKRKENKKNYEKKLRETEEGRKQLAESRLLYKYGITPKDWMRMYEEQNGICGNPDCDNTSHPRWWEQGTGIGFCVDHDHDTEKVRGLLCFECNTLEGWIAKHPKRLMGLFEYKRVWDESQQMKAA